MPHSRAVHGPSTDVAVTAEPPLPEGRTVKVLRLGLLALCATGIVGTAAELAMLRHWQSPLQLVPWFALGGLAVALAGLARQPTAASVKWARGIAGAVIVVAAFGVMEHVMADYRDGAHSPRYSARWKTMSEASRWWAAASGGVGEAPTLAPGVLAEAAFCLALATVGHPAGAGHRRDPDHHASRAQPAEGSAITTGALH
jgi:hypothetical protein